MDSPGLQPSIQLAPVVVQVNPSPGLRASRSRSRMSSTSSVVSVKPSHNRNSSALALSGAQFIAAPSPMREYLQRPPSEPSLVRRRTVSSRGRTSVDAELWTTGFCWPFAVKRTCSEACYLCCCIPCAVADISAADRNDPNPSGCEWCLWASCVSVPNLRNSFRLTRNIHQVEFSDRANRETCLDLLSCFPPFLCMSLCQMAAHVKDETNQALPLCSCCRKRPQDVDPAALGITERSPMIQPAQNFSAVSHLGFPVIHSGPAPRSPSMMITEHSSSHGRVPPEGLLF